MGNPLAKRAVAQLPSVGSDRPTDGTPFRGDYTYDLAGHVAWINDYMAFKGRKDRWELVEQKSAGGGKPVMTVQPVSKIGTDDWERARRAPKAPDMRPPPDRPKLAW